MLHANTIRRAGCRLESRRSRASTTGRILRWYAALLIATLGIGMTGCSDASGASGNAGGTGVGRTVDPSAPTKPDGRGTVVVTVTDALGAPLAGARVRLLTYWRDEDREALADTNGRLEFKGVIASYFAVEVYASDSFGFLTNRILVADATVAITVPTVPTADPAVGVARAGVRLPEFLTGSVRQFPMTG